MIDRDGCWTIKRDRKRDAPDRTERRVVPEIAVPMFGYKNHVGIDREYGFVRRYVVTHDGGQLGQVLDRESTAASVWADSAYRSKANLVLLARRGPRAEFQHKKPRGKAMLPNIARGNATRATIRSHIEHVFAAQKHRQDRSPQSHLQQLHPTGLAPQANNARRTGKRPQPIIGIEKAQRPRHRLPHFRDRQKESNRGGRHTRAVFRDAVIGRPRSVLSLLQRRRPQ
jgi:hypothetical protein